MTATHSGTLKFNKKEYKATGKVVQVCRVHDNVFWVKIPCDFMGTARAATRIWIRCNCDRAIFVGCDFLQQRTCFRSCRVSRILVNTAFVMQGAPECLSFVFNEDGKCSSYTGGECSLVSMWWLLSGALVAHPLAREHRMLAACCVSG